MNIYEKIHAVMQDVQYLAKDDRVEFGSTKYKALSEEKVTSILRAELLKHKLVVYPIRQSTSRTGQITHVDVTYRMVNAENPEEFIEIASCGDGADSQDKGAGKAMTYAFKYMWLRTFAIPTGEDPDKISSAELDAQAQKEEGIDEIRQAALQSAIERAGKDVQGMLAYLRSRYHSDHPQTLEQVTEEQFQAVMRMLENRGKAGNSEREAGPAG